eukprot:NODE_432_length_7521_cov_0.745891.p7 type:complete len:152 gc:universal NODE_432_length_7521_cov_0.745891:3120-3575(+)
MQVTPWYFLFTKVPFYGQGMNCAFEDVRLLMELVDKQNGSINVENLLSQYSESRVNDAHEICDLAMHNYVEMRHGVTSPIYKLRKKIEDSLHRWFPSQIIPLYTMVSFSNIPYSKAKEQHSFQTTLLNFSGWTLAAVLSLGLFRVLSSFYQ